MNIETASDTPGRTERPTAPPVGDAVSVFDVGSLVGGYRIERLVATGATVLGLTEAQVDDLFILAATL